MVSFKFPAALLLCHLTSAFALSILPAQQITGSENISAVLFPAILSNLTAPPPIPGFEVRLLFDQNPILVLYQVYNNAIETMIWLAVQPYSYPLIVDVTMTTPFYVEELRLDMWPERTTRFQMKHAVQAIYEAGIALAVKPITRRGYVPRLYAGLFLQNRQIGFMKWQHKQRAVAGATNGTVDLVDVVNSTSTLQLMHVDGPTSLQVDMGDIVDPRDSQFKITYEVCDKDAHLPETFSAFLDAIATAATYDEFATGAFVNAASVSGDIALNVHGSDVDSSLSWRRLVRTLTLLWENIIMDHNFKELDFEIFYAGRKIGEGFIMNLTAPRTSMAFSC
ncbi:MAG: hypothetical protein ASARMPRED_001872 [Alectoria sarmentosa]|nr:MAG: hypothetical protein ASARMPRED_001872 [Alectoria sarmentosa]